MAGCSAPLIMMRVVTVLNRIYLHLTICPRWILKHHGKVFKLREVTQRFFPSKLSNLFISSAAAYLDSRDYAYRHPRDDLLPFCL